MILTGPAIFKEIQAERIHIRPFDPANLGPNSYDVRLAPKLLTYKVPESGHLDMRAQHETEEVEIPEDGLLLYPDVLYLGSTIETAVSSHYVPMMEGRSSVGRLGITTHASAGFGDIGWGYRATEKVRSTEYMEPTSFGPKIHRMDEPILECLYPTWTLEISVIHPVRVYPGVRIAQVYFMKPEGKIELYKGKYSEQRGPVASRMHEDK